MMDERLRELERRVRESPTDHAAGHELVRALQRAGESGRARELLRTLARSGDDAAQSEMAHAHAPAPTKRASSPRSGVRDPASCLARDRILQGRAGTLLGATDGAALFQLGQDRLLCLDGQSLEGTWTRPVADPRVACATTDSFVVASPWTLMALSASEGRVLWQRSADAELEALVGDADAVYTLSAWSGMREVAAWSARAGEALWRRDLRAPFASIHAYAGRVLVGFDEGVGHPHAALCLRAIDGQLLWRTALLVASRPRLLSMDHGSVTVQVGGEELRRFDTETGDLLLVVGEWPGAMKVALSASGIGFIGRDGLVGAAFDGDGASWEVPFEGASDAGDVALASEIVWFARGYFIPTREVVISAHALKDGTVLREARFRFPAEAGPDAVRIVVLDGAVVVLARASGSTLLVRYEERA